MLERLGKFAGLLMGCAALAVHPIPASAQDSEIGFALIGDTGYIPAYEEPEEGEAPFATLSEYLAFEAKDWLERNPDMTGFRPGPWTFDSALGGFTTASGLYPVARAASEVCEKKGCRFGVLLGDNIYPNGATLGADGISDARRFQDMFDKPYGRFGAGTPDFTIYAMLGNHDWRTSREGAMAQMRYLQSHPNFTMPGLFYSATPKGLEGEVEIFVIDTEMLLASTTVAKDKLDAEGREVASGQLEVWEDHIKPQTRAERDMVAWLEGALAKSTARWKLVFGHHALWSGGGSKFEKARSLRRLLMPALCKYADAYMAGDDHMMEAYTDDCSSVPGALTKPLPMLVSGAGAKYRPLNPRFMAHQNAANPQMRNLWSKGAVWGFMHIGLKDDRLTAEIFTTPEDMSGRPIAETALTFDRRSTSRAAR
jgi:tartrate-resistant acid phosphatase type 5